MPEGPLIAVVDDDRSIRNATQDLLNAAGYSSLTFENARSFLGSSARASVACLVADMRMSGMTGIELHEHLASSGNGVPTIIITAHPDEPTRARASEAGITCFLAKPFTPDELLACVRKAIARRSADGTTPRS
jgi:FixJ family two-component response regulator